MTFHYVFKSSFYSDQEYFYFQVSSRLLQRLPQPLQPLADLHQQARYPPQQLLQPPTHRAALTRVTMLEPLQEVSWVVLQESH